MLSRRKLIVAAMMVLALRSASADAATCRNDLLVEAVKRAGGSVLDSVQTLEWRGTAEIFAGDRVIEIGVATAVVPFVSARSDTWLLTEGPDKKRSLILEGDKGWLERNGERTIMPEPMRIHEQQQYAIYGLMLLAKVCAIDLSASDDPPLSKLHGVNVTHASAPDTTLYFDRTYRLVAATDRVNDPEDSSHTPIEQRFEFEGDIADQGVHWPRRLRIFQNGKPYFELTLTEFSVRVRR